MARDLEPLARLDDLFEAPPEPETRPLEVEPDDRASVGSRLFWTSLVAALCAAAVYVVLLPLGYKLPYPLLFSGFFGLLALRRALRVVQPAGIRVGAAPRPAAATVPDDHPDGLRQALGRWDRRLQSSARDPRRFAADVRPRLAEIVDERLRQRHGVTRASDPRRARQLMGEDLWTLLVSPIGRTPTARELATIVDEMEKT